MVTVASLNDLLKLMHQLNFNMGQILCLDRPPGKIKQSTGIRERPWQLSQQSASFANFLRFLLLLIF
jgi:hypothetical protein